MFDDMVLQYDAQTGMFYVIRKHDCQLLGTVELPDPKRFRSPQAKRSINLIEELEWYCNSFLHNAKLDTRRADHFLERLREWGEAVYLAIYQKEEAA